MPTTDFPSTSAPAESGEEAGLWLQIKAKARLDAESKPALANYLYSTILSHSSLEQSLSFHLGNKLCSPILLSTLLYDLFINTFSDDYDLRSVIAANLRTARCRDPTCVSFSHCLLNYKDFLACQIGGNLLLEFERELREIEGDGIKKLKFSELKKLMSLWLSGHHKDFEDIKNPR